MHTIGSDGRMYTVGSGGRRSGQFFDYTGNVGSGRRSGCGFLSECRHNGRNLVL